MFKIIQMPNKSGDVLFFGHVHIGEFFWFNGTKYKKRSSRTAELVDYECKRWFYFSSNTVCRMDL